MFFLLPKHILQVVCRISLPSCDSLERYCRENFPSSLFSHGCFNYVYHFIIKRFQLCALDFKIVQNVIYANNMYQLIDYSTSWFNKNK